LGGIDNLWLGLLSAFSKGELGMMH